MAAPPAPGTDWAGFRIEAQLGEGAFGQVWAAWDPFRDQRVAIKIPRIDAGGVSDPVGAERFVTASRAVARLAHPGIVPIHQVSEHEGVPFVVMAELAGGDLEEELRQSPLSLARTLDVAARVADALDAANGAGLVHGHLGPAHILRAAGSEAGSAVGSGDVFVTGFGTAPGEGDDDPNGHPASPTRDVAGVARTVFECLTGRVPGAGRTDGPGSARVSQFRPDLPSGLDLVVARAMGEGPDVGPATCTAFVDELRAVAAGAGDQSDSRRPPPAASAVTPGASVFEAARPAESVWDETATAPTAALDGPPRVVAEPEPPREPDAPRSPDLHQSSDPPARPGAVPGPRMADPPRGVVEVVWDEPEAELRPRTRTPWIVAGVLTLAVLVVGALVVRAVNTDAELDPSAGVDSTSPTSDVVAAPPTADALAALVPAELTSCVPPPGPAVGDDVVRVSCPRGDEPELVTYALFRDAATRDAAFNDAVAALELDPARAGECAVAAGAVHEWDGDRGPGRLACRAAGNRVDLVWTEGDAAVLATASGVGFYGANYRFFEELVGRTDAAFPLPVEQALLDELPPALTGTCRRDIDLTAAAGGIVAIACEPAEPPGAESGGESGAGAGAEVVSWVRFADDGPMAAWLSGRRASFRDLTFDESDDACTPGGFDGPGAVDYEADGTTGSLLCFVNSAGTNVLFWTRDQSRIGSIAVSSDSSGTVADLLRWWADGGHLP